jgi:hypothetical protein
MILSKIYFLENQIEKFDNSRKLRYNRDREKKKLKKQAKKTKKKNKEKTKEKVDSKETTIC